MENKTAVEWIVSKISHGGLVSTKQLHELVEQAKELEKEQIEKTFIDCSMEMAKFFGLKADEDSFKSIAEQYYKETFKSE